MPTTPPRFLISISFAGEIRPFIHDVATRLAELIGQEKVLYDRFHEAEFSRARLNRYLPRLYHDETELAVAVFSSAYPEREWCGLEWDALFDLIAQKKDAKVMLSRFNHAQPEGLYGAGFCELDDRSVDDCVRLILERLALNQRKPRSHYTQSDPRYQGLSTALPLPTPSPTPPPTPPDPAQVLEVFDALFEPLKRILDDNRDLRRVLSKTYGIEVANDQPTDNDTAAKLLLAFHNNYLQAIAEFTMAATKQKIAPGPVLEAFAATIYLSMSPGMAEELKNNPDRRVFHISEHARQGITSMLITWCRYAGSRPLTISGREQQPSVLRITPQMTARQHKEDLMRRYGIDPASPSAATDLDIELEWRKSIDETEVLVIEHDEQNAADKAVLAALQESPELKHAFILVRGKVSINPPEDAKNPPFDRRLEYGIDKMRLLRESIESSPAAKL
jgi:hypothetical protein